MGEIDDQGFWLLPASSNITIKSTIDSGRAVFAEADLIEGSHLLNTTKSLSPLAHVVLRPYRKEVCAWCFAYDRGRDWKIKDSSIAAAFCSSECQESWLSENDEICIKAHRDIETFIKGLAKRKNQDAEELQPQTLCVRQFESGDTSDLDQVWRSIEGLGNGLISSRAAEKPNKTQRAAIRDASELTPDEDILTYVLSGILAAYKSQTRGASIDEDNIMRQNGARTIPSVNYPKRMLPSLFELVPDDQVFVANPMTPSPLPDYASSYLVLLSLLPAEILPLLSTDLVINLASRASHNAFSIRPEGTSDGDQSGEFLGWGVWPEASFFNHSCRPNVRKSRIGRLWSFYADANVKEDDQLCITYLGGDERDLNVYERRKRLQDQWGFTCGCLRCVEESEEEVRSKALTEIP